MTTSAARVRASLGEAFRSLPASVKNHKKLGKSLKTRRTLPKQEQMRRPAEDMADGHITIPSQRPQRQSTRRGMVRIVERGQRSEGALRTPIKKEDQARGLSPNTTSAPHHQLQSNAALLSQTRMGVQRALRYIERIEDAGVGVAGQHAIQVGLAGHAATRAATESQRQAYMARFFEGPFGESLFPPSYEANASTTLFDQMPITEYPLYRQLLRENIKQAFEQRDTLLHDPGHRMPRVEVPLETREHLRAFERPPAAGQRLCIRGARCWNMTAPTTSPQAHYIGRAYLSRRELQHLNRTGEYPQPPPDLEAQSAAFDDAVRSVRLTDTLDRFCAPVTFGKCLNCIKHDMADYIKLVVSRQQEPPIAPVNPFRVDCGPGQYRQACCWEQVHNGVPTGIAGFFPRLSDTLWTEYEVDPTSYELNRTERLRLAGSAPDETNAVVTHQPLLQLLLLGRGATMHGAAPAASESGSDIFEEEFDYEQLLPDGRSTKRVRRRLPRTYFGECNMDF